VGSAGGGEEPVTTQFSSCRSVINLYHIRNALVALAAACAVGFVVLLFGVKLFPQWAREREEAFLNREPRAAVQEDDARGDLRFLRVWIYRWEEKQRVGSWEIPARDEIDPDLLEAYPARRDIHLTIHDQNRAHHEMVSFYYAYNLAAADLLAARRESGAEPNE
jgi:hypothetical protein